MGNKKKPDDIEEVLMEKRLSFSIKDIKWIITSSVMLVLWLVTSILWVKDKNTQSDKIKSLEESKAQLEKQVATLEGQVKGVENASIIFMQNPPSELKFRLDLLEKRVNNLDGSNSVSTFVNTSFKDTTHIVRRRVN